MPPCDEINWWIDQTGSTHINNDGFNPESQALAAGKVYSDSKSGVIIQLNNKPANLALISRELLDVLHARFPGTRWWIKDLKSQPTQQHQVAS
jgi:hypothetical protein